MSAEAGEPKRRADDTAPEPEKAAPKRSRRSHARGDNVIAAFLFAMLLGCAGIWFEHDRCPGALRTAASNAAPLAIAAAMPIAGLLAMLDKKASRREKTRAGIVYGLWAAGASLTVTTAFLMAANERGTPEEMTRRCLVSRGETIPAPNAGVRDWILVLHCSDRMSLVRIDVDRTTWWAHEPGSTVDAKVMRGKLGYEWVVDVPGVGPPMRNLPEW